MSNYPYPHFEIMNQINEAIDKLEVNGRCFSERLKKLEDGATTNDFYQAEKQKIYRIVDKLDTVTAELGAIDWIQ